MNVFNVFQCDAWHSHSSRVFVGTFSSQQGVIKVAELLAAAEGETLSDEDRELLLSIGQTQSSALDGELIVEVTQMDAIPNWLNEAASKE